MGAQVSLDLKLYHNTGSYASPTWVLVDNVIDLTGPDSFAEADVSRRASAFKQVEPSLREVSFEWSMIFDEADTNFTGLRTKYAAKTLAEFAFANGLIATNGTKYFRIECKLLQFKRNEALTDAGKYDLIAKPCWSSNAPSYVTVGS